MSRTGTRPGGVFDPSALRRFIAEGMDTTQVKLARVGWEGESGTDHITVTAGQDVDVHVTTLEGYPLTARLFAPAGLWSLPPLGDECMVLAPEDGWSTPGLPVCLWRHRLPPSNVTPTRAVLEVPTGGMLVGNGATLEAARKDDPVTMGTLGFAAAGAVLTITFTPPGGSPQSVAVTIAGAAVSVAPTSLTLTGKISAGSAKVKVE